MGLFKKIILTVCILVFLFLAAVFGTGLYYYHHPSRVKTLLEKSISSAAGAPCTIRELSYSLNPLRLQAKDILMSPGQGLTGLRLEIRLLRADMTLEGAFGKKTLIVQRIEIESPVLHINREWGLPSIPESKGGGSLLGRAARALTAFFFFRDIRLEEVSLSGGEAVALLEDLRIKANNIHAGLSPDRLLNLTCGLHAEWPSRETRLEVPDLRITTDQAISLTNPVIKGRISTVKASFEGPEGRIKRASLNTEFLYRMEARTLDLQSTGLDLDGLTLIYQSERLPFPEAIRIRAEGSFDIQEKSFELPLLTIFSRDILDLKSSLAAKAGPRPGAELEIFNATFRPDSFLSILPAQIKEGFKPVHLTGPVSISGSVSGRREGRGLDLTGDLEVKFSENSYKYTSSPMTLAGILTGTLKARGRFPDIKLSVEATSNNTTITGVNIGHKPSLISVSLSGEYPRLTINRVSIHCPSLDLQLKEKGLPVKDIKLDISRGLMDIQEGSIILPDILFDSSLMGNVKMSLKSMKDSLVFSIQGKETRLIKTALATGILPPGWQVSGEDEWRLNLQQKGKDPWKFFLAIGLQNVAFQGPADRFMGEGLMISQTLNGEYLGGDRRLSAETSLEVGAGEILLDRFYFDLKKNALSVSGTGRYGLADRSLELTGLQTDLKDILKAVIQGKLMPADAGLKARLKASIPETRLMPIFEHFLLEPFKEEHPFLKQAGLGGTLSGDLDIEVSGKDRTAIANLRWRQGELLLPDSNISLKGIQLDLPLWYQTIPSADRITARRGMLSIGDMRVPILNPQSLDLPLEAGPNRLDTMSPLVLAIPGGHIRLGRIFIKKLFSPDRSADTGIGIDISDIRPLLSGALPHKVKGEINGSLAPVHFGNNSLTTAGQVTAHIFGGEIILSDIAAFGLLTPAPFIRLSASWKDLLLSDLTADTEFGKIDGLLYGSVRDLELAHGQPRRFDLWLETRERKGVPQRISVKAVDNIARIGGGASPFIGMASILTSFFKEFPYKKIGIHTTLENDVFRVNGTIKEGGKEYLIKRSGFSGVDVVNQNPDNRISFKDMVKRIKRVTSTKGGPVIK